MTATKSDVGSVTSLLNELASWDKQAILHSFDDVLAAIQVNEWYPKNRMKVLIFLSVVVQKTMT